MNSADVLTVAKLLLLLFLVGCDGSSPRPQPSPEAAPRSPEIQNVPLEPAQGTNNRTEDLTTIEGLNKNTVKPDDAAKESTPGNRKPIGMDGLDTTK